MDEVEQSNYNALYSKRQEQILIEQIKKNIDYEVRLTMFITALEETRSKLEEATKNSESQNDITQQAIRSVEDLTIKNKQLQVEIENNLKRISDLEARNADKERNIRELTQNRDELVENYNNSSTRIKNLERELERQRNEMQQIYDENVSIKKNLEENNPNKQINKNKKPRETLVASPEDNIF